MGALYSNSLDSSLVIDEGETVVEVTTKEKIASKVTGADHEKT